MSANYPKGTLYTLLSGVLYGCIGYLGVQIISSGLSISNMLFWRFLCSGIIVVIFASKATTNFNMSFREAIRIFIMAAFFYSASAVLYFMSSQYIGTGLAMVLFFTYPAMVAVITWARGEHHITKIDYCSFALIVLGMVLLSMRGELVIEIEGIALAILSAVFYAAYILMSKGQSAEVDPIISTVLVSFGSAVMFLLGILATENIQFPISTEAWVYMIAMAMICTSLPMVLFLKGLKYISAAKASILSVLEPVFVVVIGSFLLHEVIEVPQIIGIVAILGGAVITQFQELLS